MKNLLFGLASVFVLVSASLSTVHAAPVPGQGTWQTSLQGRDLDGNAANGAEAFYDTILNITWLSTPGIKGLQTWSSANAWATSLSIGGYSGWRLPMMVDVGENGCTPDDCGYNVLTKSGDVTAPGGTTYSEMAHLFLVTLGNKSFFSPLPEREFQPDYGLVNTGDFHNFRSFAYWYETKFAPNTSVAWMLDTRDGGQYALSTHENLEYSLYATAVHPGDIGMAIPEPGTFALLCAAFLGFAPALIRRRRGAPTSTRQALRP